MSHEAINMNFAERALVKCCSLFWALLKLLDPKPVQRYFATRVNVSGQKIICARSLLLDGDAESHVCRINNNRMKLGGGHIAKRGDLIKIFNPSNNKFVLRYAHGSGDMRLRFNDIGLDYDARVELGVLDQEEVEFEVMKANPADREFYLMYQDKSVTSRHSRALGWYMLLGSLLFTAASALVGAAFQVICELAVVLSPLVSDAAVQIINRIL